MSSKNMTAKNLRLISIGRYLKSYELDYESEDGHKKSYEFVSHKELRIYNKECKSIFKNICLYLCQILAVIRCSLGCFAACGILVSQPGLEPVSPVLKGRFLTTGPPGKSLIQFLNWQKI